ncbi:DUF397 domain-containing protein [Streptantibioticus rubrisoli]|uniref:DUF397 domain-containing protein n=1 Tax=Streptantibioticus rubrisoli TaxID=1387313 RepID=A0ABT1PJL7_9ACTN|nr:DUF397 domain-containing protein [Streptantibioticus rubrisoli]MCQ4045564.1 DUF397 domain-containing protein [Streptantibioticus rubrisoli]
MNELVWFKSSYSGGGGGQCVEVAYDWQKSSHSGAGGQDCIEIATHPTTVHVRDSKDKTGPVLDFTPEQWSAFVEFAAAYPGVV